MTVTSTLEAHEVTRKNDTTEASELILQQLSFHELTYRYEKIVVTHQKTFEWLFNTPVEATRWRILLNGCYSIIIVCIGSLVKQVPASPLWYGSSWTIRAPARFDRAVPETISSTSSL